MGVRGPGESVDRIFRRRPLSHPFAVPPVPDAVGVWQIRRVKEAPIGYVLRRPDRGGHTFHAYAHCRDSAGKRPWLAEFPSLNSAVAWMIQHERDLARMAQDNTPEPDSWPR